MSEHQVSPRRAAWEVLSKFDPKQQNAGLLIEEISKKMSSRAMLVEIALGVIRNLRFIDSLIVKCSGRQIQNIQPKVLNCLRIAVYELIFTNQAQYAAVDEAVELTKKVGSQKASGFTNAVLRKILSSIKNKNAEAENVDSKKFLPLTSKTGCEFNIDVLADEKKNKTEHLSGAFSLPRWFAVEICNQYDYATAKNICLGSNRRPSVYARPNILKVSAKELVDILRKQDVECELIEKYKMVKLEKIGNIAELESFKAGLFTIQDITASQAAVLLHPKQGQRIFDICAAPGTKTTQLAEITHDKGFIVATDIDSQRLKKINENVERLGITSVNILNIENFQKEISRYGGADAILLDVPCSNTGVLAKRPEVRFRLDKNHVNEITKTQMELLMQAAMLVNKGGRICYSTCSILKQENSDIVNEFISVMKNFTLAQEKLTLPSAEGYDCDGGFAAILEKK